MGCNPACHKDLMPGRVERRNLEVSDITATLWNRADHLSMKAGTHEMKRVAIPWDLPWLSGKAAPLPYVVHPK